jgi:hypothetical protein
MDLLDYMWPAWLYEPAGAPLHAAFEMKEWYIQKYNDPIVQWSAETASGHDSWMGLFMHLEFFFLLPTVLYAIYRLAVQRRGTSGGDELLFLVYALEVAFTTLICIYDTGFLDEAVYPAAVKRELQFQLYAPWFVLRKCLPQAVHWNHPVSDQTKHPSWPSTWRPGSSVASRWLMPPWEPKSRSRSHHQAQRHEAAGEKCKGICAGICVGRIGIPKTCLNTLAVESYAKTPWYLLGGTL